MKIALVGPGGVGKDTLAEYAVQKYGLVHVSSSDLIRQHILEHNLGGTDRVNCRHVGNQIRAEKGAGYLVRKAIEMRKDNIVVSGLRAVAEATTFKELGGTIIAITAPLELRYEWAKQRADIDNAMTFEQFRGRDEAESVNPDPNAQNINAVVALADYTLTNNADRETLYFYFKKTIEAIYLQ